MVLGTICCDGFVFVGNFVYLNALDRDSIAFTANESSSCCFGKKMFGSVGTIIMAVLVMISTFGCVNGIVLAGARVFKRWQKTDFS